jgi:hypothetical protein
MVPSTSIDLDWQRDAAGYVLLPEEPSPPGEGILRMAWKPLRIIPRGGALIPCKPLQSDQLYARFAQIYTAEDVLAFMNKWGPLTTFGGNPDTGECVSEILEHASSFRSFLSYGDQQQRELAAWVGSEGKKMGRLDFLLAQDPASGSLCLKLAPPTLLAGLWLQLAQKVSGTRPFRQCRYCNGWFETGPGTGRRLDATFCIDDHRVLFNSRKRARGKR